MQIVLIYNPKAGHGDFDCDEVVLKLRRAGHDVESYSIKQSSYKRPLKQATDLVLVAGGDGTVGKIACELIGRNVPISVLPVGIANNLARTLGFTGAPEEIIASIDRGARHHFDVGHAAGACGDRYFFEGAGGGLLPDYWRELAGLVTVANKIIPGSKNRQMVRHVAMLRRLVGAYKPDEWRLKINGKEMTGRYMLVEAMNIRSVGPILNLAARAKTDDGQLDLVTVQEEDRKTFSEYLDARLENHHVEFPFPARRFRCLEILSGNTPLHFDDKVWPKEDAKPKPNAKIEITVEPGALPFCCRRMPRRSVRTLRAYKIRVPAGG
jgi:Sphingosine kinase and enzymes related to eukaryotic diacylglycerol kinase